MALTKRIKIRLAIAAAIAISGCAVAPPPIAHTPNIVATPEQGQLAVSVAAAPTVGEVTPVYVSIANGTDATRSVVPSQVFALNESGERVAPLPPGEAARQAGSAKELQGAIESAAVSGVGGAAVGAGAGAIAGAAGRSAGWWGFGSPGAGALVGTAFGGGWGILRGAERGQTRADQQANQQIEALALKPEEVRKDFTVSGYVFFPKGQYNQVQMLLVDRETGDTQVVNEPWH
ncbi:MAG: hypothetical protein WCD12_21190 [Candidatus Binatus sp.]|jgi:hypothetical protein|uniref:hypothetical protein n=2 Tax=Candidatus Binatus sp. TaxID=2811406 RepID=UPI003C75C330